ncbi:hypothetical protein BMETH_2540_0 [methanotrophic bacterial endosymbiont of Bathymodiolus sp.]|nr:hypothetical protein BMETH_2540_0 [methanotrophic bacterial endosymbiont of Bathymodiolus sp.]
MVRPSLDNKSCQSYIGNIVISKLSFDKGHHVLGSSRGRRPDAYIWRQQQIR